MGREQASLGGGVLLERVVPVQVIGGNVQRNADRGVPNAALYEVGPQYAGTEPDDQTLVAAGLRQGETPRHWAEKARKVDAYDASRTLVIDPVFVYSTYLGGSGDDKAFGVAVDGAGNVNEIRFEGVKRNTGIPDSAFDVKLPDGVNRLSAPAK